MDPSAGLTSYLFTQGVLGFAVFVLGWVCIKLYNSRENDQTAHALEVKQLQKEKEDIIVNESENIRGFSLEEV